MIILISQRHNRNIHSDWIDSLENNYVQYFKSFGITLIPVSNIEQNIEQIFPEFNPSGVILTGGDDVDPELYGSPKNSQLEISKYREKTEKKLLETAIKNKVGVFGICRGMQIINVYFDGKIFQDLSKIDTMKKHPTPGIHDVKIMHDELVNLLNNKTQIAVNSYHNHGVLTNMLGEDLKVFSIFEELNLVEGLFHINYPIAAIGWHPERPKPTNLLDKILVDAFINNRLFWKK